MNDTQRPNILIFMTDHQRADTLSPWGRAITPNLDRFAQQGLTFTDAYCPSPHCCPSRATFMTGLYPSRHGVWNNICNSWALSYGLNDGVKCWSEDLRGNGYEMGYTGKWHVSVEEGPEDRGWNNTACVNSVRGTLHGCTWDDYDNMASGSQSSTRGEGEILRPGWGNVQLYKTTEYDNTRGHWDEKITDAGIELLKNFSAGDSPWALFIGCAMPHDPYYAPGKYLDLYHPDDIQLPASYYDDMAGKPGIVRRMRHDIFGQLTERETRETIRHYLAMCTWLDELFGEVLAELERGGQADNTLVLYCSDHGDYIGEHGLFGKGIPCYQGAYHIPAVMRWPAGMVNPGRTEDAFVSLADFGPTFQEIAGIVPNQNLTGKSLLPFLRGETPAEWRDEMHTQCDGVELYYTQRSVKTREYKYIFNGFDDDELYDLRNDPDEIVNQARNPEYAEIVREMLTRLWRFARKEDDKVPNPYMTVGLTPYGPGCVKREDSN